MAVEVKIVLDGTEKDIRFEVSGLEFRFLMGIMDEAIEGTHKRSQRDMRQAVLHDRICSAQCALMHQKGQLLEVLCPTLDPPKEGDQ